MLRCKGWLMRGLIGLPEPSIKTIIMFFIMFDILFILVKLRNK